MVSVRQLLSRYGQDTIVYLDGLGKGDIQNHFREHVEFGRDENLGRFYNAENASLQLSEIALKTHGFIQKTSSKFFGDSS